MFLIHYNLFREKMAFERRKISYGIRQSRGIRIVSTSYAKTKRYRFLDKSECSTKTNLLEERRSSGRL